MYQSSLRLLRMAFWWLVERNCYTVCSWEPECFGTFFPWGWRVCLRVVCGQPLCCWLSWYSVWCKCPWWREERPWRSCLLQGLAIRDDAISKPGNDAATQDALSSPSIECDEELVVGAGIFLAFAGSRDAAGLSWLWSWCWETRWGSPPGERIWTLCSWQFRSQSKI